MVKLQLTENKDLKLDLILYNGYSNNFSDTHHKIFSPTCAQIVFSLIRSPRVPNIKHDHIESNNYTLAAVYRHWSHSLDGEMSEIR